MNRAGKMPEVLEDCNFTAVADFLIPQNSDKPTSRWIKGKKITVQARQLLS